MTTQPAGSPEHRAAFFAEVATHYERRGFLIGQLSAADTVVIDTGYVRMLHPGDVANHLLVARSTVLPPVDGWIARAGADWAEAQNLADASKARWAAMTPEELHAETWGREPRSPSREIAA